MKKSRTEKVVCYVVQDEHLLVFTHRDVPMEYAGVQVPAGTIEPGESPGEAAVREASEETCLDGLSLVRKLGEADYDFSPARYEVMHRHFFQLPAPTAVLTERWEAGESDPAITGDLVRWTCWWLRLDRAHVLAGGQGQFLGALYE